MKKGSWKFNKKVADNFEDMVQYSIPCYDMIQEMIIELSEQFLNNCYGIKLGTIIDLGASPGLTMEKFISQYPDIIYHAVEYSVPMVNKLHDKAKNLCPDILGVIEIHQQDLNKYQLICPDKTNIILLSHVLMFVKPKNRLSLLKKCRQELKKNGAIIIVNKIKGNGIFKQKYINFYHEFKNKHYTWKEIHDKEKALEGVLIPSTVTQDINLIKKAGFRDVNTFFQWYNFVGYIARKRKG